MIESPARPLPMPVSPARELVEANARLKRQVTELLAVQELAQSLAGELHLDALLEMALGGIASLVGAHELSLLLVEPARRCLVVRARRGTDRRHPLGKCYPIGEGLAGWVARHQVPLLLPDIAGQPHFQALARQDEWAGGALVAVPLLLQERPVGVVCAAERAGGLAFEERDLRLLIALAPHLAIAIRNAQLYEDLMAELTRAASQRA